MSWYEETSKNNDNDNNNMNNNNMNNNNSENLNEEERTVNSKGYIDADDPANKEEVYENAYDRPFEGTAREEINTVPCKEISSFENNDENKDENNDKDLKKEGADGGKDKPPYYDCLLYTSRCV